MNLHLTPDINGTAGGAPVDFRSARRKRAELSYPLKTDLPPHSTEAEQGILGCCLLSPQDCVGRVIEDLPANALYDLRHRTIFEVLVEMHKRGDAIDILTLQQRLKDKQLLEGVGGLVYLASLPDAVPSAANLDYYLDIVSDKFLKRELTRAVAEASSQLQDHPDLSDTILENLIGTIGGFRSRLPGARASALASRMFRQAVKPPELPPVYMLAGVPICTAGNLTSICSHVKTGKSAFIGAMITAAFDNESADTFSLKSKNPVGKSVIHIDTEQSPLDHWNLVDRAVRRAFVHTVPPWLQSYCLTGESCHRIQQLLRSIMKTAAQEFGGLHSVLIDGLADLVADVNDAAECNAFVASLHAAAIEFNCPIVGVIHMNPGTEKSRGHLGSQFERKAESNLTLEKDGEQTSIFSTKQRRAPITKENAPRFRWDDGAGMHISCTGEASPRVLKQLESYRLELNDVFKDRPSMRYGELAATIKSALSVDPRTAQRRVAAYRQHGLIESVAANLWSRTP